MDKEKQIEIMKDALERIANLYGNLYNPNEAVIIAREAKQIARMTLAKIK